MKKLRVSFLSSSLYSYFFPDLCKEMGGNSRIYRIVKKLSTLPEFKISCIIEDFGQPERIEIDGITLVKSPIGRQSRAPRIFFDLLKHKTDLLVDFYASSRIFLLAILKLINKRPFVFFVGSDWDVNGGYANLSNGFHNRLYEWGLRRADLIICQTGSQAATLKERLGLDSIAILSPYVEITQSLDLSRRYILWVGRIPFYKRPHHFLDLAEALPDEKFIMICNPYSKDKASFEQLLARARLIPNLEFIESVPLSEMSRIYSGAKFLVNTSDFEGFPNTFIEAAVECTPVVSLNVDPNEMLSRHGAGICCGGSRLGMLDACRNLSADVKAAREMGVRAREYAVKYHDIEVAAGKIAAVLKDVMEGDGRRGICAES